MSLNTVAVEVQFSIHLRSALHIGTGLGLAQILDDRIVQGPHPGAERSANLPYIPGSSIKGRLRHHVRELSAVLLNDQTDRVAVERRLFGFSDSPGSLIYTDAHLADTALAQALSRGQAALIDATVRAQRSFVGLSPVRRVAREHHLFRIELADSDTTFQATIAGRLPLVAALTRRDLALLLCAIRDLTHLGGHKGRGLGRCEIDITHIQLGQEQPPWQALIQELREVQP